MTQDIDVRAVGMGTIDDRHLNDAHRYEQGPGYSDDDEALDPHLPGDPWPRREPKSRGGSQRAPLPARVTGSLPPADQDGPWHVAARMWLTRNPERSNRECQRALREAGHSGATTKVIQRIRDEVSQRTQPPRPAEIEVEEPRSAKVRSGEVRSADPRCEVPRRKKAGRRSSRRRPPAVIAQHLESTTARFCDGCDMAIGADGRCRC
ncbi:hypothetical protein [Saccharothrix yanglingensis]|uniref:Uncharacterized protein n=1 Tax=Saccharothrix yanglingensis TaxID=659496 RepID=A0ABU0X5N0_9PSEU|nr:hypothetical protein [Saccharothrix yanglingensis]MDQ2585904.1 hypothetical protein [Saccharothrix yanglingensis]